MTNTPFTFKKVDGKWKAEISGKFAFEMFSVYGIPIEMTLEEIGSWTPLEKLSALVESWQIFAKQNDINLDEVRTENLKDKDEKIAMYDKLKMTHE